MLDFALWDFFAPVRVLVDFFTLLRAVLPLPVELFRVVAIFDNLLLRIVEGALEFTATSHRHPRAKQPARDSVRSSGCEISDCENLDVARRRIFLKSSCVANAGRTYSAIQNMGQAEIVAGQAIAAWRAN